jgi:DNA-binding MarR family transcriptional regulator
VSSCINGLVRWGYVVHHADPNDSRPKPPRADWVVLPTTNGRRWHDAFTEVIAEIERGWEKRDPDAVAAVRECLAGELASAPPTRPQFLPFLARDHRTPVIEPEPAETEPLCLLSSMSRVLLAQAYLIEPDLPLGLALSANVVRAAGGDGVLVRDLPARSGVAKQEATTMTSSLRRSGHISVEPDANAKGAKRIRLTDPGRAALDAYRATVAGWDPPALRGPLVALALTPAELHADGGWRSKVRAPDVLPHFPVVTGHGGYPDGS